MCVLALHLAKELCRTDEDGEHWVSVMRKVPVLPSVLSAVEISLRCKHNLYFTEAALHLLLTLARTPQVYKRNQMLLISKSFYHSDLKEWAVGFVLLGGSSCCWSRSCSNHLPPPSECV